MTVGDLKSLLSKFADDCDVMIETGMIQPGTNWRPATFVFEFRNTRKFVISTVPLGVRGHTRVEHIRVGGLKSLLTNYEDFEVMIEPDIDRLTVELETHWRPAKGVFPHAGKCVITPED